jgi:hypothetical protein
METGLVLRLSNLTVDVLTSAVERIGDTKFHFIE